MNLKAGVLAWVLASVSASALCAEAGPNSKPPADSLKRPPYHPPITRPVAAEALADAQTLFDKIEQCVPREAITGDQRKIPAACDRALHNQVQRRVPAEVVLNLEHMKPLQARACTKQDNQAFPNHANQLPPSANLLLCTDLIGGEYDGAVVLWQLYSVPGKLQIKGAVRFAPR